MPTQMHTGPTAAPTVSQIFDAMPVRKEITACGVTSSRRISEVPVGYDLDGILAGLPSYPVAILLHGGTLTLNSTIALEGKDVVLIGTYIRIGLSIGIGMTTVQQQDG